MWTKTFESKWVGYLLAVLGTAAATGAFKLFGAHVDSTTVALGLLLVAFFLAVGWGARPAVLASLLGVVAEGAGDGWVRLSVEDEGAGVPVELRERVFDKFFRAMRDGDSGTHQPPGTGMGLAIAKGIVEAHGGQIRIEDARRGRGSCVVLTLPVGDDEGGAPEGARVSRACQVDGREAAHTYSR